MLVALIIGMIMLFAVGSISEIGKKSHKRISIESGIYNDIAYGFKLIRNRVHESGDGDIDFQEASSAPWIIGTDWLKIGNEAFGVYDQAGDMKDIVYLPDIISDPDVRKTILSVPDTDELDLHIHYDPAVDTYDIIFKGTKNDIPFEMKTVVKKRML